MKSKPLPKNPRPLTHLALVCSVLTAGHAMAQTWTGNTNNLWDTDTNWSDTPPASSGSSALIFNPLNGIANLSTLNDLTSFTATSISFDNSTTAGAYTLAGNQITLGGNITTTGSTGTPTHTISLATILNGNRSVTTAINNNLTISGNISEDMAGRSLTKAGAGTLTLTGVNSFSGSALIDKGTLTLSGNGTMASTSAVTIGNRATLTLDNTATNLGDRTAGAITSSGGTINFLGNASATTETTGALTLNAGALTINSTPGAGGSTLTIPSITRSVVGGTLYVNGAGLGGASNQVVLTTAPALTNSVLKYAVVNNGSVPRFATHGGNGTTLAPLANASHVTAINTTGATTNLLLGNATHGVNGTGARQFYTITLDNGALVQNSATIDRVIEIMGGGVLQTGGSSTIGPNAGRDVSLNFGANEALFHVFGTLTLNRDHANTLLGTAGLTKSGTGNLILNGASTLTTAVAGSAVNINQGTLELRGANALLPSASSVVQNLNGATLRLSNNSNTTYNGAIAVNADSTIQVDRVTAGATATTHTVGALTLGAGRVLSVVSNDITSGTAYGLTTGDLTLSGAATVDVANNGAGTGTMTVGTSSGSFALTKTGAGDLVTNSITTGFSGPVGIQAGRVGWSGASGNVSQSQVFSGAGGVIKTGAGTVTLTGTNTYTGNTNVDAGTLVINGSISTSLLTTVASGATISGDGTTGALTVLAGGAINPGNSPGDLDVIGNYTQAGVYNAEITGMTAGTQHDQIKVAGTVDITGGSLVALFSGAYSLNDMVFILLNDGTDTITGTYSGLAQGAVVSTYGGFDWKISYVANSGGSPSFTGGNDIVLMAVPEPRAALLGGLGMLLLLRRRRNG